MTGSPNAGVFQFHSEDVGYKEALVIIVSQTEPLAVRENKAHPTTACLSQEDLKNLPGRLNNLQGFFFLLKSKTVRPGAEKKLETDPQSSQKVNTNISDKFHLALDQNLNVFF